MSKKLIHLAKARSTLDKVLQASIADETELVWFQRRHRSVAVGDEPPPGTTQNEGGRGDGDCGDRPRLTVLIRVVEGGRVGWHRTDSHQVDDLQSGLRQALAVAKVQPQVKRSPLLPKPTREMEVAGDGKDADNGKDAGDTTEELPLFDSAVAKLSHEEATEILQQRLGSDESGRLHWSETRVTVRNSHGLYRASVTSEISLMLRAGRGSRSAFAAGSARRLQDLQPERILSRARDLRAPDLDAGPAPASPEERLPVVLAPEVVVELLNLLNAFAFSGRAFLDGSSFLSRHRDVQVFDRTVHVRDNALRVPGMPFPFDLEGSLKTPVDLIVKGQPSTPALDHVQGSHAGLRPTAQSVGGRDAMFGNLFLLAGAATSKDLLAAADGGLWIGWIDPPECDDPQRLQIRTTARGVRRIEGGELGEPVGDLVWEIGLLAALGRLLGIGNESVVRAMPTTPLGGISAPALALAEVDGFRPRS